MKPTKKMLAIVLALVMVFSFAATAFAANGGYDITITSESTGHTFVAYQILKGTVTGEKAKSLGDPAYGDNVNGSSLASALDVADAAALADYISNLDAAGLIDFAAEAAKYVSGGTTLTESPAGTYKATGLPAGYYLVVDETELAGEHDANSRYILAVVTNVEVTAKIDYPDVEKDVMDYNDSDSTEGTWGKSADYDIGDDVEFRLTGDIPDTTGYKTYYYAFHDEMDDTFGPAENFKVTVGGVEISEPNYEIVTDTEDDCSFEVIIKDLISVIDSVKDNEDPEYDPELGVVVTYEAELLEDAITYNPGQNNTVQLEFSNNPNWSSDGSGEPENPPTGTTEKKTVKVFTYDVTVTKIDGSTKQQIPGAEFLLEKKNANGDWEEVDKIYLEAGSEFKFNGIDDGSYRLSETKAPAGYNQLTDYIYFEVDADHTATETDVKVDEVGTEDDTITIVNSRIATTIENNKGANLPETGGIGTTIFYIVGGIIVLAAVVLLITKRRMKNVD